MNTPIPAPKSWMSLWVIGTVGGSFFGLVIGFGLELLLRFRDPAFLIVAVLGLCIGLLQWAVALKGIVNGVAWILATTIASTLILIVLIFVEASGLVPPVLVYYNPGCLSASCDSSRLDEAWLSGAVVSIFIISLATVLPTSIVLSHYSARIYVWILGGVVTSMSGVIIVIVTYVIIQRDWETLSWLTLTEPLILGLISAPFAYITLKEPAKVRS
jgi:hypothetical protein